MKARRFINLVAEKCSGGMYPVPLESSSLRRIKASHLFYGSTEDALLAEQEKEAMVADPCTKKMITRSRLPPPHIKFYQSRPDDGRTNFWPFYGATSESIKILCVDTAGESVLYNADAGTLETLPRLPMPMRRRSDPDLLTMTVALPEAHDPARPEALYIMDHKSGSFETLVYKDPSPYPLGHCVWRWRQLPMPPFTRDRDHGSIGSYAMLREPDGGGTIYVSSYTDKVGTYCFDTAGERWNKTGSWRLPFRGRGQVIPELDGLCFGLGSYPYNNHLCAMDLSTISIEGGAGGPPKLRHHWPLNNTPTEWMLENVTMAYLGAGRFCVAKTFCFSYQDPRRFVDHETFLNGVEVAREDGGASKSNLRMIRHKCARYRLINHRIHVI